jgi:hypothetical protein
MNKNLEKKTYFLNNPTLFSFSQHPPFASNATSSNELLDSLPTSSNELPDPSSFISSFVISSNGLSLEDEAGCLISSKDSRPKVTFLVSGTSSNELLESWESALSVVDDEEVERMGFSDTL